MSNKQEPIEPLPAPLGSAKYVPVKCKACGWEDGLREDIVAKGDLTMYCDSCGEPRPVELISPND